MYVNKCIKCGAEFETKNPKRVICPNCLYAEKGAEEGAQELKSYSSYSAGEDKPRQYDNNRNFNRGGNNRSFNNNRNNQGGGGYQQRRSFNNNYNQGGGGRGGFGGGQGGGRGGFGGGQRRPNNNNRFQQGNRRPRPQPKKQAKPLLVSKEQLEKIEALYKTMLPLPNADAHEVIGAHLEIEPRKVFFGINLVRQKLMLPKLPFPKRKLAVTPDQMTAIKSLYTPLLPLPPIGCHKIIAAQLRVDEWRVHVAIKLIRAQMGLDRWNEDRPDKPADYMVPKYPKQEEAQKKAEEKAKAAEEKAEETPAEEAPAEEAPKKRGRKKKEETVEAPVEEAPAEEAPKKRGRKPKKTEDE